MEMQIAYIIPSLLAQGPNIVCYDLVCEMQKHGHKCTVFFFDAKTEKKKTHLDFPCETEHIGFLDRINFDDYDIIHTHEVRPNLYVLRHRLQQHHARFVCTIHNYVFHDYKSTYGLLKGGLGAMIFMLSILRHDKLVTLSKDMMRYYRRFFPSDKLTYVYNTRKLTSKEIPADDLKRIETFKKDGILIGTNCRILLRKNLSLVFKALTVLPENYRFIIIGDGPDMTTIVRQCNDIGVKDRVLLLGSRPDAYKYLPLYDVFVIPSESEGFPLSLLEAAAYGKKCVCSDINIFRECFVSQGEHDASEEEIVITPLKGRHAIQEFADNIVYAYNHKMLGDNIQRKFLKEYSSEAFYEKYLSMYHYAVNQKK